MEENQHHPVFLREVLDYLRCQPGGIYVDGTVGSGGHAQAILERSSPTGKLVGLDWDEEAIRRTKRRLASFGRRVRLIQKNYKDLGSVLETLSMNAVDGILLDLGVSTDQLEDPERGFSFRLDGPLSMRMSQETETTAQELLRKCSAPEISRILWEYGDERWANRIAKAIVTRRKIKPIRTTRELAEIVEKSVPFYQRRIHPATRTFQALRIAVNHELENLTTFLTYAKDLLKPGGRICIISFHSLEDRIVKEHFRRWAKEDPASFRILTPKPMVPSPEEILFNPRSRSAKLRVMEKISDNLQGRENG